ncbi:hypothetical protein [Acinetobacter sp. P8-3-8]|uniref:hypothetical protein n=1 Tax=Acinetobacter sp. P8-3-8 TaxID=1029823 RepID=UPI000248650C|nr:hypothetical protein [Acinetobacter sp. P8-3-8]
MKNAYLITGFILIVSILLCILLYSYLTHSAPKNQNHSDTSTSKKIAIDPLSAPTATSITKQQPSPAPQTTTDFSAFLPQAQVALEQNPLLNGTEILANWHFTNDKKIIIDTNIKDSFDYLLVVYPQVGQTGVMALAQHILQEKQSGLNIESHTKQINEASILDALTRYIHYQAQAEQLSKQINLENMQDSERLKLVKKIRIQYLGQDLTHAFYEQ